MITGDANLIETLTKENEEYRKAKEMHEDYAKQLDELEKRPHLTPQDEMEIKILKKKKLVYKDQMEKLIIQFRRR
jgi:uncharacterized protein